jgi:uncharacterized protein YerC
MQISKRVINKNIENQIYNIFYQVIADLENPEEAKKVLEDLLGKNGVIISAKRLAIAHYLEKGRSYQNIKDTLKVSSATISSVDKQRKSAGYQLALKKIETERWASDWGTKIENLFKKK